LGPSSASTLLYTRPIIGPGPLRTGHLVGFNEPPIHPRQPRPEL
jgi:hypothetical protein